MTQTLYENISLEFQITNPVAKYTVKNYIENAFDISNPVTDLMYVCLFFYI